MTSRTLLNITLVHWRARHRSPRQQSRRQIRELMLVVALLFLLMANLTTPAAVNEASTLQGSVFDEKGALVVGADISLNEGGVHKYTTATRKEGHYSFVDVSPGRYTLTASALGFADFTQPVELAPSHVTTLDITLTINLREQVEVRAARDSLTVVLIDRDRLKALPHDPRQLHRRLRQLARATGMPGDLAIYVDGIREGRLPPKEAIESIRVSADSFAAEFAEPAEARVDITTRPAADRWHGELNFSFNNASL